MQNLFNTKTYTAEDLISLLLPKLQQRGIRQITEEELSRDLYYYSEQPKFKNLFIDMNNNNLTHGVDIYDAMFMEKYIAGRIKWDDMRPTKLFLSYSKDFDFSYGENLLTEEGLLLVNTIADELSIKYKVEASSKININIYNIDPNQNYTLIDGSNHYNLSISWKLLTNGDIKTSENAEVVKDFSCERPGNTNKRVKLNDVIVRKFNIEKASYVVVQCFENCVLKNLKIYTNLTDLESLQQISKIANCDYIENVELLVEENPIVKKIILS